MMDLRELDPNLQSPEDIDRIIEELRQKRLQALAQPRNEPLEIRAVVTRIIQSGVGGGDVVFSVKAPKSGEHATCICSYFCPIQENDSIYAICIEEQDPCHGRIFRICRPPFVLCPQDKEWVVRVFIRILKGTGFGDVKARKLYTILEDESRRTTGKADAISELTELASVWMETHDDSLFLPYEKVLKPEQLKKLLFWWHKNRSLRRLWLLGLTNKEIESCRMSADEIYERCLRNPYPLVGLSLEKCDEVLARQNKVGTDLDRRCGQVVRCINDFMNNKAWTSTPSKTLLQMFPDLPELLQHLSDEFEVTNEFKSFYLNYAFRVEDTVARRIDTLIRMNPSR